MDKDEQNRKILLTEERRSRILAHLRHDGRVLAAQLSQEYGVSDDTIRRDLDALAEQGLLQRVHGGALRPAPVDDDYGVRQTQGADAKESIARATAGLIHSGQVVILDGGTTTLAVAKHLAPDLKAKVITTSPQVAVVLAAYPGVEVITVGGTLYRYAMVAVGADTVTALRAVRADVCVLGILALHPEIGVSVIDPEEAVAKRAMIEGAACVVAPATAEKLGTVAPFVVAPASTVTHLVVDAAVAEDTLAPYRALGITVIQGIQPQLDKKQR